MNILKWTANAASLAGLVVAVVLIVLASQGHTPSTGFNLALAGGALLLLGSIHLWALHYLRQVIDRRLDQIQHGIDRHIEQGLTLVRAQAGIAEAAAERANGVTRLPSAR
jgi:hypothetical protein